MKFKKAVLVKIPDSLFEQKYWDQIDQLVEERVSLDRDDPNLASELKDCDCLMLGYQVPIGKDIFQAAPNLKLINISANAYGTVDLEAANKRKIPVCNIAGYSTEAVAEFVIAVLLYQVRQLGEGVARAKAGNFDFEGLSAREIKGKKFGVVGLGRIGNRVAELAAGFGAKVSYWSRDKKDVAFAHKELSQLLSESDYISLNVAQTQETESLLNAKNIPLIKSGAVLVSTVPNEVIDINAVAVRVAKGDLTYISDHGHNLPQDIVKKLQQYPNCLLLSSIAFITAEARTNMQETFVANLQAALAGKPQNKVN